jgi:dynein heavy chain 1
MLEKHIGDLISNWNKNKPINGTQRPKDALIMLGGFEDKFKRLKDEQANILKAKNALEISDSLIHVSHQATSKLEIGIEELNDLSSLPYTNKNK